VVNKRKLNPGESPMAFCGNCVEVADGVSGLVPVRDSKNRTGPVLLIPASAWARFVGALGSADSE
jgi:Domain of unknown function (DUF397)